MKINGVEVSGPNEEFLVLPRSGGNIVFRARAIRSFEEFDALVPPPKAPGIRTKAGFTLNEKDPTYREQREYYDKQRYAYMVLKSLEPSEIEWTRVKIDVPGTWVDWKDEFQEAGFNEFEINRIQQVVSQANSLDEGKLEEARKNFLLGEEEG